VTVADGTLLNYEDATSHSITVEASDGAGPTSSQTFTINVTDVNPSTPTDTNAGGNTVAEGAANGSTVGITASSTDPNGPAVTYTLSDNAGGRFAIDSSTGVVTVADGTLLNYEDATSHSITVEASDGAGPTSSQTFTINVTDVVENAAPVANGDIVLTNVTLGNPILIPAFALLANDTDAENNTLSIGTVSNPAAGDTVAITSGDVTYTDQNPLDGSFQYTAFDGTSNSAAASVTVDTQTGTTITGTAANEILIGTAQADTLIGGQGNDILIGNAGNDTYVFSLNDGNDMILDATGANDKIQINGTPITSLNFLNDGSGNLVIDVNNTHVTVMGHYTGTGVEQIAFTSGGTVYGYSLGTATYNISTSASGSSGNTSDVVAGTSTANTIDGGGNNSSSGNDLLFGNAGNDVLTGQGQNDLLVGGAGNDSLTGGSGADVFAWKAGDQGTTITPASDTITDFDTTASSDKLTLSDLLLGESHTGTAAGNLANYLHFSVSSGTTTLQISTSGDFTGASDQGTGALTGGELAKVDQVITFTSTNLVGVNLTQDTIISSLFSAQKLLTD
jgi:Ca2+-binding RTX toxin-like protein